MEDGLDHYQDLHKNAGDIVVGDVIEAWNRALKVKAILGDEETVAFNTLCIEGENEGDSIITHWRKNMHVYVRGEKRRYLPTTLNKVPGGMQFRFVRKLGREGHPDSPNYVTQEMVEVKGLVHNKDTSNIQFFLRNPLWPDDIKEYNLSIDTPVWLSCPIPFLAEARRLCT